MIKMVFSIYDSKSELYEIPVMFRTKGEAVRGFIDLCNDKTTEVNKHPEDFSLWYIADYDDNKGHYFPIPDKAEKLCMGQAIEMKEKI